MSDFSLIRFGDRRFQPEDALTRHKRSRKWLSRLFKTSVPRVVVTHHAPSWQSVAARYKRHEISPAFASNLDELILQSGAALWVHGHTHDAFDYQIGVTRVVCNPRGYPNETPVTLFNPSCIIEI